MTSATTGDWPVVVLTAAQRRSGQSARLRAPQVPWVLDGSEHTRRIDPKPVSAEIGPCAACGRDAQLNPRTGRCHKCWTDDHRIYQRTIDSAVKYGLPELPRVRVGLGPLVLESRPMPGVRWSGVTYTVRPDAPKRRLRFPWLPHSIIEERFNRRSGALGPRGGRTRAGRWSHAPPLVAIVRGQAGRTSRRTTRPALPCVVSSACAPWSTAASSAWTSPAAPARRHGGMLTGPGPSSTSGSRTSAGRSSTKGPWLSAIGSWRNGPTSGAARSTRSGAFRACSVTFSTKTTPASIWPR